LIANQLKLWIWRERSIKKISYKNFFPKLQNGGLNGDGAINHCFFSFGSNTAISQPNSTNKPILDLLCKHFGIQLFFPKKTLNTGGSQLELNYTAYILYYQNLKFEVYKFENGQKTMLRRTDGKT
jgi:hypothetical protein